MSDHARVKATLFLNAPEDVSDYVPMRDDDDIARYLTIAYHLLIMNERLLIPLPYLPTYL